MGIVNQRNQIKSTIDAYSDLVRTYHTRSDLLRQAEQLVPVSELLARLSDSETDLIPTDNDEDFRQLLLPLVLDWFANEFFSWFDNPECDKCHGNPPMVLAQQREQHDGLAVEHFQCRNYILCRGEYEFKRYRDPGKLLETRSGRCGEWASCFLLILRSLDYDARLVVDVTDHVWCEVWSERLQRWQHVDPGEGIDRPLVYEAGWKKKLSYCLAVSPYEVQDVTWRYVIDLKETCSRRVFCDEAWLASYLITTSEVLLSSFSYDEEFKSKMRLRKLRELASFIRAPGATIKKVDSKDLAQRKTGSLAWRIARGEFSPNMSPHNIVTIRRSSYGLVGSDGPCLFNLKYNCCQDLYTTNDLETLSKWSSLIYEAKNVDRKFERDWKMAYIARYESCPPDQEGEITWRFDLREIERDWKMMKINLNGQIYPNTSIDISFVGYIGNKPEDVEKDLTHVVVRVIEPSQTFTITSADVYSLGSCMKKFDINVKLNGGIPEDGAAWQKPQLFRQSNKTDYDLNSFILEIY